jgi:hypothetical protein
MYRFNFYRLEIRKGQYGKGNQVCIRGEIQNCSPRPYNAVSLRAILRHESKIVANTVIVVNGLEGGATKAFSKSIDELEYDQAISPGTKCECQVETAY